MFGLENTFWRDPTYRFARGLALERVFPRRIRHFISILTGTLVLLYIGVLVAPLIQRQLATGVTIPTMGFKDTNTATLVVPAVKMVTIPNAATVSHFVPFVGGTELPLDPSSPRLNAIFLLALALWLSMKMLAFYRRSYFYYVEGLLERGRVGAQTPYTTPNYEVCDIYYDTAHGDLLKSFCLSPYGRRIMRRSGVSDETMTAYLSARKTIVNWNEHESELRNVFTLLDLSKVLIASQSPLGDTRLKRASKSQYESAAMIGSLMASLNISSA